MQYNLESFKEMDNEVAKYEIYLVYGHGVVESPLREGPVVETLECMEIEAWICSQQKNFMLWGPMCKRSSWASPTFSYRKVKE